MLEAAEEAPTMRRQASVTTVLGLLAAAMVAGCAQPHADTAGQATSTSQPRTIVATLHDINRTVVLAVGDHLELALGRPPDGTWTVASSPTGLLELRRSDRRSGQFLLVAQARGQATVYVRNGAVCGPPRLCPAAAGDPVDAIHGQVATRAMRFTVVIR
jgi:hypothetical protein